jgi:hypothetical protein
MFNGIEFAVWQKLIRTNFFVSIEIKIEINHSSIYVSKTMLELNWRDNNKNKICVISEIK